MLDYYSILVNEKKETMRTFPNNDLGPNLCQKDLRSNLCQKPNLWHTILLKLNMYPQVQCRCKENANFTLNRVIRS